VPVFVDINRDDLNIDVSEIEKAITPATCAIMPVHIYGNPCDVSGIEELAHKHRLKVIYDAAHCFGVQIEDRSVLNWGDLSVLSLHATKVFSCIEGGAIICHDIETKKRLDGLKNTGIGSDHELVGYGLNAKMNELQAAYGLVHLKYIEKVIEGRKAATSIYTELLTRTPGIRIIAGPQGIKTNYTYFPILIDTSVFGATRDEVLKHLALYNIQAKTYFHPLVTSYPEFGQHRKRPIPNSEEAAKNILCLPLYHDITRGEIERVVDILLNSGNF
jgi:dTDP-4-amino-4,6-dideoxygalactose transaminase